MRLIFLPFAIFLLAFSLLSPGPARAQIAPEAAVRVLDATLTLRSGDGRDHFLGSGFAYGSGTRALTNAHVVGKAASVVAVTRDGTRIEAQVVAVDTARDLALLTLSTPLPQPLQAAGEMAEVGATVYAAGAPLEAGFTLTHGIVSARDRQVEPTQPVGYLQHSAPVNPGSSGGPLVDETGAVLGVNARISDGSRFFVGIGYAVPLADVQAFVKDGALAEYPPIGLQLRALSPRIRAALRITGPGVLIEQVQPDSPADLAGLRAGDILRYLGSQVIAGPGDVAFALAATAEKVAARVERAGAEHRVTLSRARMQTSEIQGTATTGPQRRDSYKLADMGLVIDPDGTLRGVVSDGAGYQIGLTRGDRIDALDGVPVTDLGERWVREFRFDAPLLMRIVLPGGGTRHYVLDPWEDRTGLRLPSGANMTPKEVVSFD